MVISIELFGIQRDIAKTDKIDMPANGNAFVRDAIEYVKNNYPALALDNNSVFVTVNNEPAPMERVLKANDTVYLCLISAEDNLPTSVF